MTQTRIILIAKEPCPGQAKTRLIPALGKVGAAQLADRMLRHTLAQALEADVGPVELCVSPDATADYWQQPGFRDCAMLSSQIRGDLGQRMADAAERGLQRGRPVMLIGTDCPDLTTNRLRHMARILQEHDACLCPVADGGYALLGFHQFAPTLFTDIPWSTAEVARITRQRLRDLRWRLAESETLNDIDEPDDLHQLTTHYPGLLIK